MRLRKPILQAVLLVVVSTVIAVVANAFAAPTRRLALPAGYYPNALKVPPREPARVPPPPVTETGGMAMPVPAETTATLVPVPDPLTTTTVAPPATTPTTGTGGVQPAAPAPTAPATTPSAPTLDPLARFQPHPDKAYIEISGDDAALLYANGTLFLDARRTAAYEESHIAGARPFSVWEADVDDKVSALYEERQDHQDQPIVIYCTGGACEDSHMLSQKLWGIQFNNVYVYKDGFPDWQKRRGAVRAGAQP